MPDDLTTKTDEELRQLAADARAVLEEREKTKRREAMEHIKKIAADNGLTVDIKIKPPRKRGRPKKSERASAPPASDSAPSEF